MPPPTTLSHFPDLCILAIFKHIPLCDLVTSIGQVCRNWARILPEELKNRNTLVLVKDFHCDVSELLEQENTFGSDLIEQVRRDDDGLSWVRLAQLEQIKFNVVQVPGNGLLGDGFTARLLDLLPNITQLTVVQYEETRNTSPLISSIAQVTHLIDHYSTSLVSLKLQFTSYYPYSNASNAYKDYYDCETNVHALFNSMNQLESLRHVRFNIDFSSYDQPRLSFLSRLNTFSTHKFVNSHLLIDSLSQYPNGNIRIDLDIDLTIDEAINLELALASKFTRFKLRDALTVNNFDKMRLFCDRFVSLTTLELNIDSMPMNMLARCLSQLTGLIHLKLHFGLIPPEDAELEMIAQVPSVRLLTLTIHTRSHLDTERLYLAEIFPNLQVIDVTHYSIECKKCEYEEGYVDDLNENEDELEENESGEIEMKENYLELPNRIKQCFSKAREPFKNCKNMHTIRFATDDSLDSLFPQGLIISKDEF